jgi:hypothetical protein
VSPEEQVLLERVLKRRKLFHFLRMHRLELFDDAFQAELERVYRDTGAGKLPLPPALLAMVVLLQAYDRVSDAEAVDRAVVDRRWQMVLDCRGATRAVFSQGALFEFRQRLVRHDLDRRLVERTVELARATGEFDWKQVKALRVAVDSAPLEGAGRVEDTFNLLGHAARKIVECAASRLHWTSERVATEAKISVLNAPSLKSALDVDWSAPAQKAQALRKLLAQLDSLQRWVKRNLPEEAAEPPLSDAIQTLQQIVNQNLEPDPTGHGRQLRRGTAEDRRISIEDPHMRHGRKSSSRLINGYKRHIAADLDSELILGCAMTAANRPEHDAGPALDVDLRRMGVTLEELHIDRAYLSSSLVGAAQQQGGQVVGKPWSASNDNALFFTKADFRMNWRAGTITCPAGQARPLVAGRHVAFDKSACRRCKLRGKCFSRSRSGGRSLKIHPLEPLLHRLRKNIATRPGRAKLRQRVGIEHRLAHLVARQGARARYRGLRSNLFDLRRTAAILNLETIQRKMVA